ncbi:hypothetical protein CYMTET_47399 [Cymbomonas tetramitiformis]|uniref:Uncharacterized protein n=1 Tax=Cymbomonas tetramitiformis TaxID=36881 RepID=A0AAE0BVD9_9CHLO|nr:hypothetical protein CYMTET_47399 [Cymbomonas tetramitiformis]
MNDEKLAEVLGLAINRRAIELLFAVAEANRMGLPTSHIYKVQRHEIVTETVTSVPSKEALAEHENPSPEPAQATVTECIAGSSSYTRGLTKGVENH